MAEMHIVEQGEYLTAIAARYGFADCQTIWNDARNAQPAADGSDNWPAPIGP